MSSTVPEGWSRHKLGDSLSPQPKSKLPSGESNPLGYYDFYVCSHKVLKSFHNEYSSPSILFSTGGEASVHFATERYAFSTDVWATEFEGDICNEYVFRLLEENIRTINYSGFQGSGIKHLDKSFIEKLEFSIPPLPEQKKIASILTSVDEVIENTQKQIDKLQDLKRATMNELLTKGIGHTEFKDSELGRIPESWEVANMSSITQVIDSLHETPTFSDFGIPMVRVTDIKRGDLSVDNAKTVSEEDYRKFIKKYEPKLGDIVMSRVGSYGVSSYVSSDKPFCMGQNTVIINPVDINGRFLYECLESDFIQRQIELEVAGSGYKSLSLADIRALAIPVPPMHEQERIKDFLLSIDGQVTIQKQKLYQTQSLKKSLMQDLLTGKVRVSVN